MPARPEGPWFWKGRGWHMYVNGQRINLKIPERERESDAWLAFYDRMAANGQTFTVQQQDVTVAGLCGLFLEDCQKRESATTYQWYAGYLQSFSAHSGSIVAANLRPSHVTDWIDARRKETLKGKIRYPGKSPIGPIRSVKAAVTWGVQQGLLSTNPLLSLKKPKQHRRQGVLTAEQRSAIKAAIKSDRFLDFVTALEQTGARVQEVRSVEARHYDAERKAWVFPAHEHKTGKRTGKERIIPLNAEMVAMVERLNAERPKGAIFRNRLASQWTANAVRCQFRRLKKLVPGLPANLCGTHFRHSLATDLVATGTQLDVIRQILGHEGFDVLAKFYLHSQDVNILRDAISNIRGGEQHPTQETPEPKRKPASVARQRRAAKPRKPADRRR